MPEVIDNIKVGEFIKKLLKKKGMTQEALAQELMISKSAVSQNLNGKSSFDIQNLLAIANIFEMSLDDLLNCHIHEEDDKYMSEYMRFASKGLKEVKKHNPSDLHIQEPDIYGKVFVDYLIDNDFNDIFVYLDENNVLFFNDFYHRAKEILIKIIIYMLRKEINGVIKYIKKFTELNNGFDLTKSYNGLEVWNLLNGKKHENVIKDMIELRIDQELSFIGIKHKKSVKAIPKNTWIESIGTYRLNHILDIYINHYASKEDFYQFTSSMLLYDYIDGVTKFLDYFFKDKVQDNAKSYYNFQKTIFLIIKHGNFDLFKKFMDMEIYESLTDVIVVSIRDNKQKFYDYILKNNESKIFNTIDYAQVGYAAVKQTNLDVLETIKNSLDQKTLNYLLSEVNREDTKMLYYLISNGAQFDFKYYNSNTMINTNNIITYLMKKDVK